MTGKRILLGAASVVALSAVVHSSAMAAPNDGAFIENASTSAQGGATPANAPPGEEAPNRDGLPAIEEQGDEIVVTGIRSSLERAAEIKREAVQVVDSVVAQDIGKFPDPTTASALQRVPGVQVQNDGNNELSGVRIRGLTDITTTVDGREVFTTTGRNFDLQDLSADALARVDVYKSQTADLIDGGVAGTVDLKLNKPFNFNNPTVSLSARANYGVQVEDFNPQFGALVTDRWDTGIGEIGVLLNATMSNANSLRTLAQLTDRRDSAAAPIASPGFFIPNVLQNVTQANVLKRRQVNGAVQWQISPSLEAYVDGLYTKFINRSDDYGFNVQAFTTNTRITNVVPNDDCFAIRSTAAGQNPTIVRNANGTTSLQPHTTKTLCDVDSVTLLNAVANQTTGSQNIKQINKLIAGGLRFDEDRTKLNLDVGYQTSDSNTANLRTAVGQRIPEMTLVTDDDGGSILTVPGDFLTRTDRLSLRNQLIESFNQATGSLFQARADGEQEFDGLMSKLEVGLRYVRREANFTGVQRNTPLPFGNIGTNSEANARLVSQTGLPSSFLGLSKRSPRLNGGSVFFGPSADFLRSDTGRDAIRAVYKLAPGRPADDPLREFNAAEKTYAAYGQLSYDIPFGSDIELDGVVGVRVTKTERDLDTFAGAGVPVRNSTSSTDILPNATARLQLPGGLQARLSYSKAIRRPEFSLLNPALNLIIDVNPAVLSTGSSGNPNLRPQKSDSFDGTVEYYFRNGFLAITGYYRTITDRVITAGAQEDIGGRTFVIARPRNLGRAKLQGIEASGQYFLDFLPDSLRGFGLLGAFTFADSKVQGGDPLAGNPLQGVSKYNFTSGLVYDNAGLSARLVYTYRSRYINEDLSGQVQVRRFDPQAPNLVYVPTLLEYARPAGRLDFSVGYDVNDHLRLDFGGTNILRTPTRTYRGESFFNGAYFDDETTYTVGFRARF